MREDRESSVNVEVEKRLEDLFGEGDEAGEFEEEKGCGAAETGEVVEDTPHGEEDPSLELEVDEAPQVLEETGHSDDAPAGDSKAEESPDSFEEAVPDQDSPLRDLKSIVLSLDWEISDELMSKFLDQIGGLKKTYAEDRTLLLLLHLLESVGKYIRGNKAKAHPSAVKVLNWEYASLENIILAKGMTEAERKKILLIEVRRFRQLKEEIALRKAGAEAKRTAAHLQKFKLTGGSVQGAGMAAPGDRVFEEDFSRALREIKELIRTEFEALRAELKSWREEYGVG